MLKETRENFPNSFGGVITDNGRVVGDYVLESERVTKWKAVESENNTGDATDLIANSEDETRHNKGSVNATLTCNTNDNKMSPTNEFISSIHNDRAIEKAPPVVVKTGNNGRIKKLKHDSNTDSDSIILYF